MNERIWRAMSVGAVSLLSIVRWSEGANTYSVTNLGDLPLGGNSSSGYAINLSGQTTGDSGAAGGTHAFIWKPTTPNGATGSIFDLGDLPNGSDTSAGRGLNVFGQVVGLGNAATGGRAFLWTPSTPNGTSGSMVDLGDLPGGIDSSVGLGINVSGQVAGQSGASTGDRPFLWTPSTPNGSSGSMVDLGDLPGGANAGGANGINASGQVVGTSGAASGPRAFLWTPSTPNGTSGSMVDVGELPGGADYSEATAINASGQVAGLSNMASGLHAFLWTPSTPNGSSGSMIDLGDLTGGVDTSQAFGINAFGQVVGASGAGGGDHAFLWTSGDGMLDLNGLLDGSGAGWTLMAARGINDAGQIVGLGLYDADGPGGVAAVERGFMLTVVPEPGMMGLISLAAMALIRRRPV